MMEPARLNFRIRQGSTFTAAFTIDDDGVLWDLTGWTARMQIRPYTESKDVLLSLTQTSGITLGGAAGSVTIVVTDAQTSATPAGSHVYDLEMVPPGGTPVYPVLEGKFVFDAEVTR